MAASKHTRVNGLLALLMVLLAAPAVQATSCSTDEGALDWTYNDACEVPLAPAHWQVNYPDCGGAMQSPINFDQSEDHGCSQPKGPFTFSSGACTFGDLEYKTSNKNWEVGFTGCSEVPYMKLGSSDTKYELAQFHVHAASEHTFNGEYATVELHLVHLNEDDPNDIVVLGFLLYASEHFKDNEELNHYWSRLAAKANDDSEHRQLAYGDDCAADPYSLLPSSGVYYSYDGSLTTPPCSETVQWVVMKQDVHISDEQMQVFFDALAHAPFPIVDERGTTNRPVQPLNGRTVSVCPV